MNKALQISIVVFLLVFSTILCVIYPTVKNKVTKANTNTVMCSTCASSKRKNKRFARSTVLLGGGGMIECLQKPNTEYDPKTKTCKTKEKTSMEMMMECLNKPNSEYHPKTKTCESLTLPPREGDRATKTNMLQFILKMIAIGFQNLFSLSFLKGESKRKRKRKKKQNRAVLVQNTTKNKQHTVLSSKEGEECWFWKGPHCGDGLHCRYESNICIPDKDDTHGSRGTQRSG